MEREKNHIFFVESEIFPLLHMKKEFYGVKITNIETIARVLPPAVVEIVSTSFECWFWYHYYR